MFSTLRFEESEESSRGVQEGEERGKGEGEEREGEG